MKTCAVRRTALVIAIIGVLCLTSVSVFAAQRSNMQMQTQSQQAMTGAGGAPMVQASNVTDQAWIYTNDIINSTPQQVNGSIQISAVGSPVTATSTTGNRANIYSKFNYNNSNYTVQMNNVASTGNPFGGVGIMRPVFGNTGVTVAGLNLPQTLSYVSVFGNATITKDGQTIASDQPAVAMVTQELHDPNNHTWLSTADPNAQEIHLMIPGRIQTGGTAVTGFPNGFFYIYWPSAAINMSNVGGTVQMSNIAPAMPAAAGRGAVPASFGAGIIGTINISLTNSGISKAIGTATAGDYSVVITNNSSCSRGLVLKGTDLCCTQFTRFSQLLQPGQSQTFRFFFAPGKVTMRDFVSATKTRTAYTNIGYGSYSSSILFE